MLSRKVRGKSIDYFENSRCATYALQQYAIDNPAKFDGYGAKCWGITASDGPGPATRTRRMRSAWINLIKSSKCLRKISLLAIRLNSSHCLP